jgi:hypothetical protein
MSAMSDERPSTMNTGLVVIGTMMALYGFILLLERFGIVRPGGGGNLGSILLIGFGLSRMFRSQEEGSRHGGFLVFVGVWFLVGSFSLVRFGDLWPLLLVAAGISAIWTSIARGTPPAAKSE